MQVTYNFFWEAIKYYIIHNFFPWGWGGGLVSLKLWVEAFLVRSRYVHGLVGFEVA